MTRKRWTTAQLCALYERAVGDPVGDDPKERREVAREVRAVLKAKTLADATGALDRLGRDAVGWRAARIREEAGTIEPGKCPTCGRG